MLIKMYSNTLFYKKHKNTRLKQRLITPLTNFVNNYFYKN